MQVYFVGKSPWSGKAVDSMTNGWALAWIEKSPIAPRHIENKRFTLFFMGLRTCLDG
jgi:hypothetical protein